MSAPLTRILLVEDSDDDYLILEELFAGALGDGNAGVLLQRAASFDEGLRLLRQQDWNLLIVDYLLGSPTDRTGMDFVEAANHNQIAVPAIVLSSADQINIDARMLERIERNELRFLAKGDLNWDCLYAGICELVGRPVRVLIVDQNEGDAQRMRGYLEEAGQVNFAVDIAGNRHDAARCLRTTQYHAVIIDYYLDHGHGMDLVAMLEACQREPLVILCTGSGDLIGTEEALRMIGHGRCRLLSKSGMNRDSLVRMLTGTSGLAIWGGPGQ